MDETIQDKPRRMRGDDRRAYILTQTKKVFARRGYLEASTAELAEASGVTEPMLYRHFASKKALFLTIIGEVGEQFNRRFFGVVEERARRDPLEALGSILSDYRAAAMADWDDLSILAQITPESADAEIVEVAQQHSREMYAFALRLLDMTQSQGLLPARLDLTAAAWGTLSLIYAVQFRRKLGIVDQFDGPAIQEINRLWLQSLKMG